MNLLIETCIDEAQKVVNHNVRFLMAVTQAVADTRTSTF
jgi:hypothetical protein